MIQAEAVFENISDRIKQELWKAQKAIHIAVAWFTNKELFDILKIKAQNNCKVFIIINDDEINNNSSIGYDNLNIKNIKIYNFNDFIELVKELISKNIVIVCDDNIFKV